MIKTLFLLMLITAGAVIADFDSVGLDYEEEPTEVDLQVEAPEKMGEVEAEAEAPFKEDQLAMDNYDPLEYESAGEEDVQSTEETENVAESDEMLSETAAYAGTDLATLKETYAALDAEPEEIEDADEAAKKTCVAHGDPHYNTFDGRAFNMYGMTGWYSLANFPGYSLKTYVRMYPRIWRDRGLNYALDGYDEKTKQRRRLCTAARGQPKHKRFNYKSATIDCYNHVHAGFYWLDIRVTVSASLANRSSGLCRHRGNANNDMSWVHKTNALLARPYLSAGEKNHIRRHCGKFLQKFGSNGRSWYYDCALDLYEEYMGRSQMCYSTGDPHYRTFNGKAFNIYGKYGWMTLWKYGGYTLRTLVYQRNPFGNRGLNKETRLYKGNKLIKRFAHNRRTERHNIPGGYVKVHNACWGRNCQVPYQNVYVHAARGVAAKSSGLCVHRGTAQNSPVWYKRANKQMAKMNPTLRNYINGQCQHWKRQNNAAQFYDCVVDTVRFGNMSTKSCFAHGDPHYNTFDRRNYNLYNFQGWNTLFQYKKLTVKTHISFMAPWGNRGLNDGVQVFYGNRKIHTINPHGKSHIQVKLPYHTKMQIYRRRHGNYRWMDVRVIAPTMYALSSRGLCRHQGHRNNWHGWVTKAHQALRRVKNNKRAKAIKARCSQHLNYGRARYYDCVLDQVEWYLRAKSATKGKGKNWKGWKARANSALRKVHFASLRRKYAQQCIKAKKASNHAYFQCIRRKVAYYNKNVAHKHVIRKLHKKHLTWFNAGNHAYLAHLHRMYLRKLARARADYRNRMHHLTRTVRARRDHGKRVLAANQKKQKAAQHQIKKARAVIKKANKELKQKSRSFKRGLHRNLMSAHSWYLRVRRSYVRQEKEKIRVRHQQLLRKFKWRNNKNMVLKYCFAKVKNVHHGNYARCVNEFQAQCKVERKVYKTKDGKQKVRFLKHC